MLDDSNKPFYKWFTGAQTNIVHNCLDRHQQSWRKNKLALVWVGERNEVRTYSYFALNRDVCKFANVLKAMGVQQGRPGHHLHAAHPRDRDRHAGLRQDRRRPLGGLRRLQRSTRCTGASRTRESKVVITADGGFMNGKVVELKKIVDDAVRRCPTVETVIVVQRTGHEVRMEPGRDYWYHDLMKLPLATGALPDRGDGRATTRSTSSTPRAPPGKPKGILHTHGGYMVGVYSTLKYVFDIQDEDRYWCAADPGWVTGH